MELRDLNAAAIFSLLVLSHTKSCSSFATWNQQHAFRNIIQLVTKITRKISSSSLSEHQTQSAQLMKN